MELATEESSYDNPDPLFVDSSNHSE